HGLAGLPAAARLDGDLRQCVRPGPADGPVGVEQARFAVSHAADAVPLHPDSHSARARGERDVRSGCEVGDRRARRANVSAAGGGEGARGFGGKANGRIDGTGAVRNSRQGAKTPRPDKQSSEFESSDFSVLASLRLGESHLSVIGAQLGCFSTRPHQARIVGYGARSKPPSCATCVYAYSAMSASE